jgi:hypothetical protein
MASKPAWLNHVDGRAVVDLAGSGRPRPAGASAAVSSPDLCQCRACEPRGNESEAISSAGRGRPKQRLITHT